MTRRDAPEDPEHRLRRLIGFLMDPATHGVAPEAVDGPVETHGAMVVLAGDRAYKLKKPVKFAYMDLSTAARRRRLCRRELEINRRISPDYYLGVGAILTEPDGGMRLIPDIAEAPRGHRDVEPVLVMRRFDGARLLDNLARRDALPLETLETVAVELARMQKSAPRHRRRAGSDRMNAVMSLNRKMIRASTPSVFDPDRVRRLMERYDRLAAALSETLNRRSRAGRVRRCHADLHLRNLFLDADGRPVAFDALEFDEDLATVDVGYDLAFLLMDLLHRDMTDGASRVWNAWLSETGDDGVAPAMPLFISVRAAVRAHVTATAASQHSDRDLAAEAVSFLDLAAAALEPRAPVVVAIGGISGSGKSTLARALAPALGPTPGAVILRSDVIRKQSWGVAPSQQLPAAAYRPQVSRQVFAWINRRARALAAGGHAVIADAVFGQPKEQARIAAAAGRAGVRFVGIWLDLPETYASARVESRRGDVSDATPAVVARQAASIAPAAGWHRLDAREPLPRLAERALALIRQDRSA